MAFPIKRPGLAALSLAALLVANAPRQAFATPGDLYVTNADANDILRITPGGVQSVFATGLRAASALAFSASGDLYASYTISLAGNPSSGIARITPSGAVSTFATGLPGGLGIAFDAAGNLFVADSIGNTIERITPGGQRSTFVSTGTDAPLFLAFDAAGNLFVTLFSGAIDRITPTGSVSVFATGLAGPGGLAFSSTGNLFVTTDNELLNGAFTGDVTEITSDGTKSIFATASGPGLVSAGEDAFDSSGNLYVTYLTGGGVVRYAPDGTPTVFATGLGEPDGLAFEPSVAPLPVPEPGSALLAVSSRHEVIRAKCQCMAGLGGADPVGSGRPGSMSGGASFTSGAGGR